MGRTRHLDPATTIPFRNVPAAALRAVLREGYSSADLRRDVLAGLVVGIVALPLAMALSIAVGAPPQQGLYTAIIAGFVTALLGGSRTQVTGPTAAFIVILAPIVARHGLAGLLLSGLMAGIILIILGVLRFGRLIEFIPHPVTTGFTAGIGTVIAVLQLKDFLGLSPAHNPDHFLERVVTLWQARGTAQWPELVIGLVTLLVLLGLPKITRKIPAPLVALPFAAVVAALFQHFLPGHSVATIASRFHATIQGHEISGIPQLPPLFLLPWHLPGPAGTPLTITFDLFQSLLPGAFAIAMLGAIESLLSAVVADGMAGTRHDPDAELLALGVGNVITPFFGGIPATGAIARTATNIRSGGRSPFAAMTHAITVLAAILLLAPWIGLLPMASLAALLLLVAWNMSEVRHFRHILRVAPRSDIAVLLCCFFLTVVFDMVIAVGVGIVLAALLFMQRMAQLTRSRVLEEGEHPTLPRKVPAGVFIYDIAGPLFFGAAQKAMGALGVIADRARVVILRMEHVPVMDASGLVALESALQRLERRNCVPIITGLHAQTSRIFRKAELQKRFPRLQLQPDISHALDAAEKYLATPEPPPATQGHPFPNPKTV